MGLSNLEAVESKDSSVLGDLSLRVRTGTSLWHLCACVCVRVSVHRGVIMVLWEPVASGALSTFLFLLINDKFPCCSVIECLHHFARMFQKSITT